MFFKELVLLSYFEYISKLVLFKAILNVAGSQCFSTSQNKFLHFICELHFNGLIEVVQLFSQRKVTVQMQALLIYYLSMNLLFINRFTIKHYLHFLELQRCPSKMMSLSL